MDTLDTKYNGLKASRPAMGQPAPITESTRYLGETPFGTVEKVYAVCMVVNDKVDDPKMAEKIYNYIQDMFGPESLDYDAAPMPGLHKETPASRLAPHPIKKDSDPLW